jgi:hypothetical protein
MKYEYVTYTNNEIIFLRYALDRAVVVVFLALTYSPYNRHFALLVVILVHSWNGPTADFGQSHG